MKTLIKGVEIWIPDAEAHLLELGDGLYGPARAFARISRTACFARGEGLPGRAWEERRPILLTDLQSGHFRRAAAAKAAGYGFALAYPVFVEEAFKAVVVFFGADATQDIGAIELWRNDPRVSGDIVRIDGHYGATAASFSAASDETVLPRGSGLPGLAWQQQSSVFLPDLSQPSKFVRAEEATAAGLVRGLAIPCPLPGRDNYAVTFLSSAEVPMSTCVERWTPDGSRTLLRREFGHAEGQGALPANECAVASGGDTDALVQAFLTGVPRLRHGTTGTTELDGMLALPIAEDGQVAEVLTLQF